MIEIKKIIPIHELEFEKLNDSIFSSAELSMQRNFYYDTQDNYLRRHHIVCLINEENGMFYTEIKEHHPSWGDFYIKNIHSSNATFNDDFFASMGLHCEFVTKIECRKFSMKIVTINLKKTTLFSKCHYELEVEYEAPAEMIAIATMEYFSNFLTSSKLLNSNEEFYNRNHCSNKLFF